MDKVKEDKIVEVEGFVQLCQAYRTTQGREGYVYAVDDIKTTTIKCPVCTGFLELFSICRTGKHSILDAAGNDTGWFYTEAYCTNCSAEFSIPVTSELKTVVKCKPSEMVEIYEQT